jgi:light-independent protochlorophyllide reductase subunit B
MKLSVWTYEGPPHVGAMRVATGMTGLHYVLHAPQGDTYADLLFTMIERRDHRPPVTYTTFQARDLGADTANLFKTALQAAHDRFQPQAIIVGASCTAELIQDDPGGMAETMGIPVPVVPLELPSYQRKENFGSDETFFQLVRALARPCDRTDQPSVNLLGPTALGFRHRDDIRDHPDAGRNGIAVNVVAPIGATPKDLETGPAAHVNVMLYPETCESPAASSSASMACPTPGPCRSASARRAISWPSWAGCGVDPTTDETRLRLPWWSASVDSTYLTGKRVFVFGDATHVKAMARVAREEDGLRGGRPRLLQPRIRPRHPRAGQGDRGRAADHRRLSRGREAIEALAPNSSSAPRWSAISASASASPAR